MAKWRFAINNTMYNLVAENLANLQAKNPALETLVAETLAKLQTQTPAFSLLSVKKEVRATDDLFSRKH